MYIDRAESNNSHSINLLDNFTDEDGAFIEYFSNTEYELYNETVYEEYVLNDNETNYLQGSNNSNFSNISVSFEDIYDEDINRLRELESADYTYYGQDLVKNVKDVYSKELLGLTAKSYIETTVYAHNGRTVTETFYVVGSQKQCINKQTTITNNHILTRNKNHMTNDLVRAITNLGSSINLDFDNIISQLKYFKWYYSELINRQDSEIYNAESVFDSIMDPFI